MKHTLTPFRCIGRRLISSTSHRPVISVAAEPAAIPDDAKPNGWFSAKPYKSIPGPKALPFIGNIWRFLPFIGNLHRYDILPLNQLFYKKYGSIVRLGGLRIPDTVLIYNPEDIEYLFRNEGIYPEREAVGRSFAYYRKHVRPEIFQGYSGVAEVHGKDWFNIRSKVNPIVMHPQTVLQYTSAMDKIAGQLVERMRYIADSDPQREMPDDFNMLLYAWTLESIMFVCLDKQLGCLNMNLHKDSEPSKIISTVTEVFKLFYTLERSATINNIYKSKEWKRFVEVMDFITFTFLKYIEEAKQKLDENEEKPIAETTMLQQLLKADKGLGITAAIDLLTGGVDTTGKVIGSALYFLANNPNAQSTLRQELCSLLPDKGSPITKETLSKASYLKAVIKETTRFAPIATGNIRNIVKDMVICGYQIPKGTRVSPANLTISLMEENYTRANEFLPERWLRTTTGDLSVKSTNPFVTLPFGFGPRSCLGKRIAMLELEIGIAKIVRNFYLEWHHKPATFKSTPFYGIIDPLKLRITEVEH